MAKAPKLKPCPLCGGPASVTQPSASCWVALCNDPHHLDHIVEVTKNTRAKAIRAWNRRKS